MEAPPENNRPPSPSPTFGKSCKHLADKNKLVLRHESESKDLKYHSQLKSIMKAYGFVCVSDPEDDADSAWVEYRFPAAEANSTMRTPALPGNRIDGLHIFTYRAFLDAVNDYLNMDNICDLFTVRTVPVQCPPDARLVWRLAEVDNVRFVYRTHTLNQEVFDFYDGLQDQKGSNSSNASTDGSTSSIHLVPSEDTIVPEDDQNKTDTRDDDAHGAKNENAENSLQEQERRGCFRNIQYILLMIILGIALPSTMSS